MITKFRIFENNTDLEDSLLSLSYYNSSYKAIKNILLNNLDININVRNNNGWTPLLIAINNANYDIANLLLDNGADPNIFSYPPPQGQFPFDNDSVFGKMISYIVNTDDIYNRTDILWKLFDRLLKIIDINKQTDNFKRTPLIHVAININTSVLPGHITHYGGMNSETGLKVMRKVINAGADITIKDKNNLTFLDYLSKELVQILIDEFEQIKIYLDSKKYNL